jgi:exonuclease III
MQPGQPFKVVAVNVNGLAADAKRRNFFAWLQQQRYAIVLLSETHTTSNLQGQQWVQEGV